MSDQNAVLACQKRTSSFIMKIRPKQKRVLQLAQDIPHPLLRKPMYPKVICRFNQEHRVKGKQPVAIRGVHYRTSTSLGWSVLSSTTPGRKHSNPCVFNINSIFVRLPCRAKRGLKQIVSDNTQTLILLRLDHGLALYLLADPASLGTLPLQLLVLNPTAVLSGLRDNGTERKTSKRL